ncbi:uncharacterized protein LOC128387252 [Panonychus citri]|uniref:uncharacterized protein LOC128387252 n=1 Tax=Panonychus citri TaxID=50023 RepID=UPI002307ABF9|nr:uncharacterized protein LOC128387252 [Panonychus citri]
MLWTIKRTSFFWITVILLSQSHVLFVSTTSSSSSSSDLTSSSPSPSESSKSISVIDSSPTKVNETSISSNTFSIQGIKDFIFKARGVDLGRTFSSLRGSISTPFTALMYMGSLAVGAIVMLAFYESPISPLPVPPLPDPPVGRFPPEHPIWPPPGRSSQPSIGHHQHQPHHLSGASSSPHQITGPGPMITSSSEIHQVAVRPPAGYIHRRTGTENGNGQQFPMKGQKQLNPLNSIKSKIITSKANKLPVSTGIELIPEAINTNNNNLPLVNNGDSPSGNYNGTTINESTGTINSTVSLLASFIKDKPQKLFDILMPRTSDNNKQN